MNFDIIVVVHGPSWGVLYGGHSVLGSRHVLGLPCLVGTRLRHCRGGLSEEQKKVCGTAAQEVTMSLCMFVCLLVCLSPYFLAVLKVHQCNVVSAMWLVQCG